MHRYNQNGSMDVWVSGPPGLRAVKDGVWVDIVRVAPWVFGPLGLPE